MVLRRTALGGVSFGIPPTTWRDGIPGVQASWRRGYGVIAGGGRIAAVLDSIAPSNKTVTHAQYWRTQPDLSRRPDDLPTAFGFVRSRGTLMKCLDPHYLGLMSGTSAFSINLATKWTANALDDVLWVSRQPLLFQYQRAYQPPGTANRAVISRAGAGAQGPAFTVGTTCVHGITYDGVNLIGYFNGAAYVAPFAAGDMGTLNDEAWGAGVAGGLPVEGYGYELLLCTGALSAASMLTAANNLLADYP